MYEFVFESHNFADDTKHSPHHRFRLELYENDTLNAEVWL